MPQRSTGVNQLALALVFAGVLWLMLQLGFVPASLTGALGRWWPLMLIAAGVGLTFPRVGVVPGLIGGSAVILAFALLGYAPSTTPASASVYEPMPPGARSAVFDIELGSPATKIAASRDPGLLLEADFSGPVLGSVTARGREEPHVDLAPQRTVFNPFGPPGTWQVTLPATVPLELDVDTGSGSADLDLSLTLLRELELRAGSGSVTLALPPTAFESEVRGGSGRLEVYVPTGASADLTVRLESGSTTISVGAGADAVIELRSGTGSLELVLPPAAPIRLTIDRDGSGSVTVSEYLTRRSGRGDVGVWESVALASGGRVIDVRIVSAGSGSILVR